MIEGVQQRVLTACLVFIVSMLIAVWVVVAGDSQVRLLLVSLLHLVLLKNAWMALKVIGSRGIVITNMRLDEIGMKLDFIWAPYETHLTHLIMKYKVKRSYPNVFMMGSGLWRQIMVLVLVCS
ncbi:hypothetical protein Dsin_012662 [Dipteronia sinensis]|uniref:Uncharacterized protein n=1 Tax=Dipteronia sinensis TaxID=43782 RepID=A0AAE0E8P1_9ROSI|nr:hypothetical protein Dsin_012662 [Dipteronia sinensis]